MKFIIITLSMIIFSGVGIAADTCQATPKALSITAALQKMGPDFCPGGCQTHYKIPLGSTQSIWYKGKCKKITNLSKTQPIFIPADHEGFFSENGSRKAHATLGCVGDFYHTKEQNAPESCKRGVNITVEECGTTAKGLPNPYVVEEIEQMCYPGCSYLYTKDEEVDTLTSRVIVPGVRETRYFGGNGSSCSYFKKIKLMWDGISRHEPNSEKEMVTTTSYILDESYARISCTRPVPKCKGSAGHWICYTCRPGERYVGCDNKSGDWNDVDDPTQPAPPQGHPTHSGGTAVSQ